MNEQISALMDDELAGAECDGCMKRLKSDGQLRESWQLYHLIGDALRGSPGGALPANFQARLDAEPTVLAPRRLPAARTQASRYAWSAAASVAAISFVAWMAAPMFDPPVAQTAAVAPLVSPSAAGVQVTPTAVAVVPAAQGVGDYLLVHQRYSPRSAMAGVASYMQTVQDGARR